MTKFHDKLRGLKAGKSPGYDWITSEQIQHGGPVLVRCIKFLFNKMYDVWRCIYSGKYEAWTDLYSVQSSNKCEDGGKNYKGISLWPALATGRFFGVGCSPSSLWLLPDTAGHYSLHWVPSVSCSLLVVSALHSGLSDQCERALYSWTVYCFVKPFWRRQQPPISITRIQTNREVQKRGHEDSLNPFSLK